MQQLLIEVCDLAGNRRADGLIEEFTDAEIEIPLSDARAAKYTQSIWLPQVADVVRPLTRLCRIFTDGMYDDPVFCGINIQPSYDFDGETVETNWLDGPAIRLQLAVLHTPLTVTGRDIGQAMWDLIARAANRDYPIGAPPLGIIEGTIEASYPINRTWDAGTKVWDALLELSQLEGAPDVRFVPLLRDDYFHWRFDALTPQGDDKTASVVFHYGWGVDNASGFTFDPDGSVVTNGYTAVGEAPDDGSLVQPSYYASHHDSQVEIGIYEDWETNDATDVAVEQAKARLMVGAYHEAPDYYSVIPAYERAPGAPARGWGTPPAFRAAYDVGDQTRAIAKKGPMVVDVSGRLRKATIQQVDTQGGWRVALEHAPNVDTSGVV